MFSLVTFLGEFRLAYETYHTRILFFWKIRRYAKGPFIETQLNSTQLYVELSWVQFGWVQLSCIAIDTSTTQFNSTRRRVELCRYKRTLTYSIFQKIRTTLTYSILSYPYPRAMTVRAMNSMNSIGENRMFIGVDTIRACDGRTNRKTDRRIWYNMNSCACRCMTKQSISDYILPPIFNWCKSVSTAGFSSPSGLTWWDSNFLWGKLHRSHSFWLQSTQKTDAQTNCWSEEQTSHGSASRLFVREDDAIFFWL